MRQYSGLGSISRLPPLSRWGWICDSGRSDGCNIDPTCEDQGEVVEGGRHRLTTARVTDHEVVHPLDPDALAGNAQTGRDLLEGCRLAGSYLGGVMFREEALDDGRGPGISAAKRGIYLFELLVPEMHGGFEELMRVGRKRSEGFISRSSRSFPILIELLLADPVVDSTAGTRGLHESQPIPVGPLLRVHDDLDRLAVLQLAGQRGDAAVYLRRAQ
jgi:hypothetical protein